MMAREGKTGLKRNRKNRNQVDNFVSDDSDEDYKIDEDDVLDESDEDYISSLAEDESQESLGEFEEEEAEEWIEERVKNVRMPRGRKYIQRREKNVYMKPEQTFADHFSISKGTQIQVSEEVNSCSVDLFRVESDGLSYRKPRNKSRAKKPRTVLPCIGKSGEEEMATQLEEEEDYGEDFIPSDDIETVIDEPNKKQGSKKNRSRKRTAGQTKKNVDLNGRRRDSNASSDSDFVVQATSDDDDDDDDDDYTMSEEENEFIKEANEICERPTAGLRSSTLLETIEEEDSPLKRRDHWRKGKQKVVIDMNVQIGKQVCGICLSEEGKRKAVGVLSCCTHYFCFTCIMEWSKVESRCPLCKQRFVTIRRTMPSDAIHDVRDAIFHVPERDQVYQPSEEELRGYLDPYENVLCTVCHRGGDDAVMLLCDLCDSSTHTYCVNLGREVPEGNWYCSGCRPMALASENGATNNIHSTPPDSQPANPIPAPFDLNKEYVPDTPSPSPRSSAPQIRATSPTSRSTLVHRRMIRRQILEHMNSGN